MSPGEQLALAWICLRRALRESAGPGLWRPWLVPFALQAVCILVLTACAHPAVSWFMAPLLRATAGEDALRYPGLFRQLAGLADVAQSGVLALSGPFAAAATMRACAESARAPGAPASAAWRAALANPAGLLVASVPLVVAGAAAAALVPALHGVRLSSLTRALLPMLAAGAALGGRAALVWPLALVALGRRGPLGALLAIPRTWPRGFVPAAVLFALTGLPLLPFAAIERIASAGAGHGLPELTVPVALARAALVAWLGVVLSAALALVCLGAELPDEGEDA